MVLKDGPLGLEEIVDAFAPKRKELVLQTIDYLLDEGILREENGKFSFPS